MNKLNCYDSMIFSARNILLPRCYLHYYFLDAFCIKTYKEGYFIKNNILKDYYGLCISREIVENRALVEKKIEDIIFYKSKPIGIQMDSFYLPWNNLQFQMHRTHCFLITEILHDNYICIDTFLSEDRVFINKKVLIDNIEWLFYFDYNKTFKKEHDLNDIVLFLKDYTSVEHKKHIEKIEEFANEILNLIFDTAQHIDYKNIEQSDLIFNIANVEWSRNNFSNTLKLLKNNFNTSIFDNIIPIIDELYAIWGTLKSIVIKNIFINNYYKKASQLVQTIVSKENEVIELLLNLNY